MNAENSSPKRGIPPDGYREVLYWKITEKPLRLLLMNLVGALLLIPFGGIFFWLALSLGRLPKRIDLSSPASLLIGLSILLLVLVLHELVHGLLMRIYGARPRFGVMWKEAMFYATSPGFAYSRAQYLAVALAPLVMLSLLAVLAIIATAGTAWVVLVAFVATFNASGSVGDVWISAVVLRHPPQAYIVDERDGVRIFLP